MSDIDESVMKLLAKMQNNRLLNVNNGDDYQKAGRIINDFLADYEYIGSSYSLSDLKKGGKFEKDMQKLSGTPDIFRGSVKKA